MHWQTLLLEFYAISMLWTAPGIFCLALSSCRTDVLVDIRLDTVLRHKATPSYAELHQIGVTHLGTQVDDRILKDTVMADVLRGWVSEVHANDLLTYASIREDQEGLLLAASGKALALGFDEIEFDELLSSHLMSTWQVLAAILDVRKTHPSVTITITEYDQDFIKTLLSSSRRIPNIRIAIDEYNNLTSVINLADSSPSAARMGAWIIIINDTTANWKSYRNLLTWIVTIRRLGYDLYLFTIDFGGEWKVKWSWVKYALTTQLACIDVNGLPFFEGLSWCNLFPYS